MLITVLEITTHLQELRCSVFRLSSSDRLHVVSYFFQGVYHLTSSHFLDWPQRNLKPQTMCLNLKCCTRFNEVDILVECSPKGRVVGCSLSLTVGATVMGATCSSATTTTKDRCSFIRCNSTQTKSSVSILIYLTAHLQKLLCFVFGLSSSDRLHAASYFFQDVYHLTSSHSGSHHFLDWPQRNLNSQRMCSAHFKHANVLEIKYMAPLECNGI